MPILKEIRSMGTVMSASWFIHRFAGGLACAGMLAFGLLLPAPAGAEDVKIGILFDAQLAISTCGRKDYRFQPRRSTYRTQARSWSRVAAVAGLTRC
jgi:hypothetical protein